ncbi:MAG: hypothetical protein AVDCRST_MAG56-1439, partial [uncultured Cytophagales bacterium]
WTRHSPRKTPRSPPPGPDSASRNSSASCRPTPRSSPTRVRRPCLNCRPTCSTDCSGNSPNSTTGTATRSRPRLALSSCTATREWIRTG